MRPQQPKKLRADSLRLLRGDGASFPLPATIIQSELTGAFQTPSATVEGVTGAFITGSMTKSPSTFTLTGQLSERDTNRMQNALDRLKAFLFNQTVRVEYAGRYLDARLTGFTPERADRPWVNVTLTFLANDPVYYATKDQVVYGDYQSGQILNVTTLGGNAPIYGFYTFSGRTLGGVNTGTIQLDNLTNGQTLRYNAFLYQNESLTVDTKRLLVLRGGVGAVSEMTPRPFYFAISPGINRLRFTIGGSGSVFMSVRFAERWI